LVRHADKLIKLTGLGYWDRSRSYPPALYDPATWKDRTQTAVQRAGLWIMKLVAAEGRPLTRSELESMLEDRGLIPEDCSRAYIGNAVAEFADGDRLSRSGRLLARAEALARSGVSARRTQAGSLNYWVSSEWCAFSTAEVSSGV
jgi:hypothetical protein